MSTFSNETKSATASATNASKNTGTIYNLLKAGSAQVYDSYLTYDEMFDPLTGLPVTYDGVGTLPTWTNLPKS